VGFGASSSGVYWWPKRGRDWFDAQIKYKSSLATFSWEFLTIDKLQMLEKKALCITCDFKNYAFQCNPFTEN